MDWIEILKSTGPIGVAVAAFLYAYGKGSICTGRELEQTRAELAFERQERLRERQEHVVEKQELRQELGFWRNLAWSVSKVADQVAAALPVRSEKS